MKKFLFLLLLVACANPKEKIVDRMKEVKDDLTRAQLKVDIDNTDLTQLQARYRDVDSLLSPNYQLKRYAIIDSMKVHVQEKNSLQATYDSLQTELNKH